MASTPPNPLPPGQRMIVCLYCDRPQEVAARAMTITCRHCSKSLRLEDMVIKQYQARHSLETCGQITIEKKGEVVVDKIHCGSLVVRGRVKGQVVSRGVVRVEAKAHLLGNVTAASLYVEPGAVLQGRYKIGVS